MNEFDVIFNRPYVRELVQRCRFSFHRRRRGGRRYWRIQWPKGTRLADVLSLYDVLEL